MSLAAEYMRQYGNVSVKQKNLMEDIVAYIGTNFSDPTLTPDSLAERFGLSRTALYRLFSEKLGTSPKKHINNIRIENACTILHRNDRQIKEIALSVGFNNPLYFSKVFKERNGVSPSEYTEYFKNVLA
jgi:AraC-like DNA-binding protein